uniref:Uncharacterized protein n=1 Tax=Micrurus lemniscatus lemniscatus TaxID=129467 RepID=A0A2D4IGE0_MICLE
MQFIKLERIPCFNYLNMDRNRDRFDDSHQESRKKNVLGPRNTSGLFCLLVCQIELKSIRRKECPNTNSLVLFYFWTALHVLRVLQNFPVIAGQPLKLGKCKKDKYDGASCVCFPF